MNNKILGWCICFIGSIILYVLSFHILEPFVETYRAKTLEVLSIVFYVLLFVIPYFYFFGKKDE